jgi:hypothetical protein
MLQRFYPFFLVLLLIALFLTSSVNAEENPSLEFFSPQGTVKNIRQVTGRFSEQMVTFGDPRLPDPFIIDCPIKGTGRWADSRNWVYDFRQELPAGISCTFTLQKDIKTLSGKNIQGAKSFTFSTGGPAIRLSNPREGYGRIAEDQIFILLLDAAVDEQGVLERVFFVIDGIHEKIGIRILSGDERKTVIEATPFRSYLFQKANRTGSAADSKPAHDKDLPPILVIQAKQHFPSKAVVKLIWGAGVKTVSGIASAKDQILSFQSRNPFSAKFSCAREKKGAACLPLLPMTLTFTAPVSEASAAKIVLKGPHHKIYAASFSSASSVSDGSQISSQQMSASRYVDSVTFVGPFPEKSSFVLELPHDIKDDAGRPLINQDRYQLQVKTDA